VLSCSTIGSLRAYRSFGNIPHIGLQRDTLQNVEIARNDEQTAVIETILVVLVASAAGADIAGAKAVLRTDVDDVSVPPKGILFYLRELATRSPYDQADSSRILLTT
jgi:hypothetical protein